MKLIDVISRYGIFPSPCYPVHMEIVNFPSFQQVGASGQCPHCGSKSYFKPVTSGYLEQTGNVQTLCNGAQCEACKNCVLIAGERNVILGGRADFSLKAFYPLGRPSDSVDTTVPKEVAEDFREALRCRWVEAYKASVTMCRRSIQTSCLAQGADKRKKLMRQIDELAAKGLITEPLKQFAHAVRLEGNDGAHPDPDGLDTVTQKDADDIIEFTREYLHHVYVMPAKLKARITPAAAAGP
jgi:DNA-directed RNA polymerase subunit RPC12/RpoP